MVGGIEPGGALLVSLLGRLGHTAVRSSPVPIRLKPDCTVEREVISKEQTFRSEDNAFCL
jgi:hypothetical protein